MKVVSTINHPLVFTTQEGFDAFIQVCVENREVGFGVLEIEGVVVDRVNVYERENKGVSKMEVKHLKVR